MNGAIVAPAADADPRMRELLDSLAETWASLPVDEDGELLALAYVRAAYGRGYVLGLETPRS